VYIVIDSMGLPAPTSGINVDSKSAFVQAGARKCSVFIVSGGTPAATGCFRTAGRKWAWKIEPALCPAACSSMSA
jgi:hypothetical protein